VFAQLKRRHSIYNEENKAKKAEHPMRLFLRFDTQKEGRNETGARHSQFLAK